MLSKTVLALLAALVVGSPVGMPQGSNQDPTIEELLAMDADLVQTDILAFTAADDPPSMFPIICISTPIQKTIANHPPDSYQRSNTSRNVLLR